ncbi:hypothetical protein FNH08_26565 [Streptomyces spongiae]|uniref:Uncharacterized protein n=2 Tax=Streptomyces spongiae TaxID=565072 RepID=A0A5N8XMB4_9ACTN|nr:hypothetical protein [Streptomyces spongiae]
MRNTAQSATAWLPGMPSGMPSGKDLVFYGGLGAMTVAGALEWPVALAVGGATWLVRGRGKAKDTHEPAAAKTRTSESETKERGTARKST